jgi:hypothetical protein
MYNIYKPCVILQNIMKLLFVYCLISNLKGLYSKCLCISTKTKHSDTITTPNVLNSNVLSFKNNNRLGIIYEDIEYKSIKDF